MSLASGNNAPQYFMPDTVAVWISFKIMLNITFQGHNVAPRILPQWLQLEISQPHGPLQSQTPSSQRLDFQSLLVRALFKLSRDFTLSSLEPKYSPHAHCNCSRHSQAQHSIKVNPEEHISNPPRIPLSPSPIPAFSTSLASSIANVTTSRKNATNASSSLVKAFFPSQCCGKAFCPLKIGYEIISYERMRGDLI